MSQPDSIEWATGIGFTLLRCGNFQVVTDPFQVINALWRDAPPQIGEIVDATATTRAITEPVGTPGTFL